MYSSEVCYPIRTNAYVGIHDTIGTGYSTTTTNSISALRRTSQCVGPSLSVQVLCRVMLMVALTSLVPHMYSPPSMV